MKTPSPTQEQLTATIPSPPSPSFQQGNNSKTLIIILSLLATIFFITSSLLYLQNQQLRQIKNITQSELSPTEITPHPAVNLIADWKTFEHVVKKNPTAEPEFIFEFKYPSTWMTEGRPGINKTFWTILGQEGWVMDLEIKDRNKKNVNEWIAREQYPYDIIKKISNSFVNGIIVSDPATIGNSHTLALFPIDDKMFILHISSDPPKIDKDPAVLLGQILSTFKLLDNKNQPKTGQITPASLAKIDVLSTEKWKTVYQNGVLFEIPPDATCKSDTRDDKENTQNCRHIYFGPEDIIPTTISVSEYEGGSRRRQYLGPDSDNGCNWIIKDAYFGNIKALQIAADGGLCQNGAGAIVTVVGDKFIVFRDLHYDFDTKTINRFPPVDTIVSTLKAI